MRRSALPRRPRPRGAPPAVDGRRSPALCWSGAPEERRVITVLFTDIVGSTALAEQLDPEEWRQTVAAVHATVGRIIGEHHGMVAQYLGDGLLAWFGAPQPSEYDPEHAVRAALAMQSAATSMKRNTRIDLRVGIHTGLVVVGELGLRRRGSSRRRGTS